MRRGYVNDLIVEMFDPSYVDSAEYGGVSASVPLLQVLLHTLNDLLHPGLTLQPAQ